MILSDLDLQGICREVRTATNGNLEFHRFTLETGAVGVNGLDLALTELNHDARNRPDLLVPAQVGGGVNRNSFEKSIAWDLDSRSQPNSWEDR